MEYVYNRENTLCIHANQQGNEAVQLILSRLKRYKKYIFTYLQVKCININVIYTCTDI